MKRLVGLCLALMLALSACTSGSEPSAKFKAGSYTGSAQGMNGEVVLEVTLSEDKIESITVKEQQETGGLGDVAIDRMIENIIKSQSIQVDTVVGATVSSNAVLSAVTNALSEAGVDASKLEPKAEADHDTAVEDATADIVVIGGGGAGLTAAIEAADAGAEKIIVLEKMLSTGGTTATAQGMIAVLQ